MAFSILSGLSTDIVVEYSDSTGVGRQNIGNKNNANPSKTKNIGTIRFFISISFLHLQNLQYRKSDTRYTTQATIVIGHTTPRNMQPDTSYMPNLSQHVNFDRMMVADMMATTIATIEYIRMTELTSISISFLG